MSSIHTVFLGAVLFCSSGIPSLLLPAKSQAGQRITLLLMLLGAATGIGGLFTATHVTIQPVLCLPWALSLGAFDLRIDALALASLS